MPVFKYKAHNRDKELIRGLVEAPSDKIAVEILREKGINILSLVEQKKGINIEALLTRIKPKDLVVFSRQFSVLISANVSIVQALKLLSAQIENIKLKAVVQEISEEIDGGARLSDALSKRPEVFSDFFVNVVSSGENSGKLDEVLNYLADELEKDYDMMSKIKGAMIYPAFVMAGMSGVGVMMMVFVVPKLTAVMEETGMDLPVSTKILIATSDILTNYWMLVAGLLVVLFVLLRYGLKTRAGKEIFDKAMLKTPIFGKLFQKIYIVRFTRSLETLLLGGVTISKGLSITSQVVSNQVYKDLIMETKAEVEDGNSMSSVFAQSPAMPDMVSQMVAIGEKTGKLESILGSISKFYGREIDNVVANLMTLMEPIIMVVMGIAVGIMVAAVIMPMYNMASAM